MSKDFSDIKWATCIPLIGGSAIGCSQTVGHKPEYHLSYSPFNFNERQIQHYWPDVHRFIIDSEKFSLTDLPDTPIDFVNAVCPCAGLSSLSPVSSPDSKVNDWLYESTEFVLSNIKPKVLWGENAPALGTSKGRPVANKIAAIGRKYGYSFSIIKTDTFEHGIPQHRQRTFYFLWKSKLAPIIGYHHHKCKPLYKYLQEIPEDATQQDIFPVNSNPANSFEVKYCEEKLGMPLQDIIKKYGTGSFGMLAIRIGARENPIKEGNFLVRGCESIIKWLETQEDSKARNKRISEYKRIRNKGLDNKGFMDSSVAYAYKYMNALIGRRPFTLMHPSGKRFLSIREMLHIMGLPHDFELQNWKHNVNTICQNVPTVTTRDMVKEVIRFIKGDPKMILAPGNFVIQNNKTNRVEEMRMIWK